MAWPAGSPSGSRAELSTDQAGHGAASTISEIEEFHAISRLLQLLRLGQFASDHWATLTVLTPPGDTGDFPGFRSRTRQTHAVSGGDRIADLLFRGLSGNASSRKRQWSLLLSLKRPSSLVALRRRECARKPKSHGSMSPLSHEQSPIARRADGRFRSRFCRSRVVADLGEIAVIFAAGTMLTKGMAQAHQPCRPRYPQR